MSAITAQTHALASAQHLNRTNETLGRSLSRLSSGSKIVKPSDDAAALAAAEKLGAQNRRVAAAGTNVQNAISYVQTSDGFMNSMGKSLSRLSELAILAQDATKNPADVDLYRREFDALRDQLRQTIGGTTAQIGGTSGVTDPLGTFNGIVLFGDDAGSATGLELLVGQGADQTLTLPRANLRDGAMGDLIRQDGAGAYVLDLMSPGVIDALNAATGDLSDERAGLGAVQSRLELIFSTLQIERENLDAAVSRISDVDVATESTQLAKYNILMQSGTAMLSQANQTPQSVLQLLKN